MYKTLITGITGMVGSHLADFLLANTEWDIFGMCRWRSPLDNVEHLLDRANRHDRVHFLYGDLNDYASLVNVVEECRPDYVFHLAAQSYPTTSFTSPLDTLETNILGTERLLEVLRKCKGIDPVIHVCSSSEVFGRVPRERLPIREDCSYHPASPYAISKIGTDLLSRFHAEAYKQKCVSTRMFTHTGPRRGDVFAESTFAKQIAEIEKGLKKPEVLVGNLDARRDYTDVRDMVKAYYLAVQKCQSGDVYNIASGKSWRIGDVLDLLLSMSKVKIKVIQDKSRLRPSDVEVLVGDATKFKKQTHWKPEIPFEKTMADLLNYWRERV